MQLDWRHGSGTSGLHVCVKHSGPRRASSVKWGWNHNHLPWGWRMLETVRAAETSVWQPVHGK